MHLGHLDWPGVWRSWHDLKGNRQSSHHKALRRKVGTIAGLDLTDRSSCYLLAEIFKIPNPIQTHLTFYIKCSPNVPRFTDCNMSCLFGHTFRMSHSSGNPIRMPHLSGHPVHPIPMFRPYLCPNYPDIPFICMSHLPGHSIHESHSYGHIRIRKDGLGK